MKRALGAMIAAALLAAAIPSAAAQAGGPAATNTKPDRPISWLAAGDSFSSGEGMSTSTGACQRAPVNAATGAKVWAQVAAVELSSTTLTKSSPALVACTGALSSEFFTPQDVHPEEWTPALGRFDLVSFTFGGDNVGFPDVIQQCIGKTQITSTWQGLKDMATGSPNTTTGPLPSDPGHYCPSDSLLRQRITDFAASYPAFLDRVANEATTTGGNVVVLGYPELIELPKYWPLWERMAGSCYGIVSKDADELRGLAGDLNATIGAAVAAADRRRPNGVHFTFIDVNTGGSNNVAYSNSHLFEPSTGSRHNLCAGDSWVNGITSVDGFNGSFHPTAVGHQNEGALAAGVVASRLDWSDLVAPPPPVPPGHQLTEVKVPGGSEAAIYDQAGNVQFLRFSSGSWKQVGQSSYPILPPQVQAGGTTIIGQALPGMADAVFIAEGQYSGDGTGNAIGFASGPKGWGTLVQTAEGTLTATGGRSTDNTTPGNEYGMAFSHGTLETVDLGSLPFGPNGEELPIVRFWRGSATGFTLDHDNILTATAAQPPPLSAVPPLPLNTCPAMPPDGTYSGYWYAVATYGDPQAGQWGPQSIDLSFQQNIPGEGSGVGTCQFSVPADTPVNIPVVASDGTNKWITAPAWILARNGPGGTGDDIFGQVQGTPLSQWFNGFTTKGQSPYYIPASLRVAAFAASQSAPGIVTIQSGKLTTFTVEPS